MAIDYSTLFAHVGKLAKYVRQTSSGSYYYMAGTKIPADLVAIATAFGTSATTLGQSGLPISGLNEVMAAAQDQICTTMRQQLASFITRTLTDRDTVTSQLKGLASTDVYTVLSRLLYDMRDNGKNVAKCTVTLGTVTYAGTNRGDGAVLVDKILDGYNSPLGSKGFAHPLYTGLASELAVPSETMELICTSDSGQGSTEGAESWQWAGAANWPNWSFNAEGSGVGPSLTTANGYALLNNLDFTNFSSNTPSNWNLDTGSAGTHYFQETTKTFRNGSALRMVGDGSTASLQFSQTLPTGILNGRRRYLFTIRLMTDTVAAANSEQLSISFAGTGYTPGLGESVLVNVSTLPSSYGLYSFFFNAPATLPSDFEAKISIVGTLTSGCRVYFDSASLCPVVYHGGVDATPIAGRTPWAEGDRVTFTLANDQGGAFQDLFRRNYGVQLPSIGSGSVGVGGLLLPMLLMPTTYAPTISDSLAA